MAAVAVPPPHLGVARDRLQAIHQRMVECMSAHEPCRGFSRVRNAIDRLLDLVPDALRFTIHKAFRVRAITWENRPFAISMDYEWGPTIGLVATMAPAVIMTFASYDGWQWAMLATFAMVSIPIRA